MSDALDKAFSSAERSYFSAKAAAAAAGGGASIFASGPGGGVVGRPSHDNAAQQYAANRGWVAVCIRAIATRIASQELFVARVSPSKLPKRAGFKDRLPSRLKYIGDNLQPVEGHALLDAFHNPNEYQTAWALLYCLVSSIELTGRAFLWVRDAGAGYHELHSLPSHWVRAVHTSRGLFDGWEVRPPGHAEPIILDGDEVAPFSLPDAGSPLDSLSPVQAQSRAVNADDALQTSQVAAFANGLFPQYAIVVGQNLDSEGKPTGQFNGAKPVLDGAQRRQLINAVRKMYAGVLKSGEPLIIDGLIEDIKKISTSPHEMSFLESGNQLKSRIMEAFGVSPTIVGHAEGSNRAQAVVAENVFATACINPLLEMMGQTITMFVAPRFVGVGESIVCWFDPHAARDDEMELERWRTALQYGAVSINEYRVRVLNLPEDIMGDAPPEPRSAAGIMGALRSEIHETVNSILETRRHYAEHGHGDWNGNGNGKAHANSHANHG